MWDNKQPWDAKVQTGRQQVENSCGDKRLCSYVLFRILGQILIPMYILTSMSDVESCTISHEYGSLDCSDRYVVGQRAHDFLPQVLVQDLREGTLLVDVHVQSVLWSMMQPLADNLSEGIVNEEAPYRSS